MNPLSQEIFRSSTLQPRAYRFFKIFKDNQLIWDLSVPKNLLTDTRNQAELPVRSKKAGRFEKLLGFARSHSIVTRGLVSVSCATTQHPSCFSKYQHIIF